MGCTTGKQVDSKHSSNELTKNTPSSDFHGRTYSNHKFCALNLTDNSCSSYGGASKKGEVQVDYINDPNQTDQITAKITRNHSSTIHKRSFDCEPHSTSPQLQHDLHSKMLGLLKMQVGTVQETSEFEEQGTNHDLVLSKQRSSPSKHLTGLSTDKGTTNYTAFNQNQITISAQ